MAISKRTRFEVLRRDNYTCRYCRSTDNPLRVDHVTPVALGGTDRPDNLVAACHDCNAGKSSIVPDSETIAELTDEQMRFERAKAIVTARHNKEAAARADAQDSFLDAWAESVPWANLPKGWRGSLTMWLARGLSIHRIIEAIQIAGSKTHLPSQAIYPYMAKIAWNWIAELEEEIHAEASDSADDGQEQWTSGFERGIELGREEVWAIAAGAYSAQTALERVVDGPALANFIHKIDPISDLKEVAA